MVGIFHFIIFPFFTSSFFPYDLLFSLFSRTRRHNYYYYNILNPRRYKSYYAASTELSHFGKPNPHCIYLLQLFFLYVHQSWWEYSRIISSFITTQFLWFCWRPKAASATAANAVHVYYYYKKIQTKCYSGSVMVICCFIYREWFLCCCCYCRRYFKICTHTFISPFLTLPLKVTLYIYIFHVYIPRIAAIVRPYIWLFCPFTCCFLPQKKAKKKRIETKGSVARKSTSPHVLLRRPFFIFWSTGLREG